MSLHYVYGLYKKNAKYKTDGISEHLFYVGIASGDSNLYYRRKNHRHERSNPHKLAIINKHDFILRILWTTHTREEAEDREEFLIRWFGRRADGGILCNVCANAKDTSRARKYIKTGKPKRKRTKEENIANRDRNLTVPHEEILLLIEEWKQNPIETQNDFAKRKGISRGKFKDWLRLYAPECVGLTKKWQLETWQQIQNINSKKPKEAISEYVELTGYSFQQAKGIYYRLIKR